jgi:hypothetical protein
MPESKWLIVGEKNGLMKHPQLININHTNYYQLISPFINRDRDYSSDKHSLVVM